MTITTADRPRLVVPVVGLTPGEFEQWLRGGLHEVLREGRIVQLAPPWQPGQHWALLGKTREGKTNFAVWILSIARKFVFALDCKGGDESLSASGWRRILGVPPYKRLPRELDQRRAEGKSVKVILGLPSTRTTADDAANQVLMRQGIEYVRQAGHWALYVDEHQILSDQRMFRLGSDIARMAISAARDGVSVVASMQWLAWVEQAAVRQSTLITLWRTRDMDLIKTAARRSGRPWQEIAAAMDVLPKYWALVIPDEIRAPMMMVKPPKVT